MSTCIPYAAGIWNMDGPPNWGLPGVATRVVNTIDDPNQPDAIKDPRWRGAFNQSFGIGAAEDASFRALWYQDANTKQYIYFSWHVKFDSDSSIPGLDRIFVAIAPSTGGGPRPLLLEIQPFNDNADHLVASEPSRILAGWRRTSEGPAGEPIGAQECFPDLPDWLDNTHQNIRVWRRGAMGSQSQWAVHMRIPIDPMATDVNGNAGLRLTGSFKMWYEFRIGETTRAGSSTTGISAGGVLRLNIPDSVTLSGGGVIYPDPNVSGKGETYTFGSVGGINDISCASSSGISLGYLDIGTDNVPSSNINSGTTINTFWAKPTNHHVSIDVPANTINATFRLANWGSTRLDALWTEIRTGVSNSGIIAHGGTRATQANDIRFDMTGASVISLIPSADPNNPNYEPHQCMLVELSGGAGGVPFTTTSACRNMDFIPNSKHVREAEISVVGLKSIDGRPRDVYLAVERLNMPANTRRDLGMMFGPILASDIKPRDREDKEDLFYKVQTARELIEKHYNPDRHPKPEHRLALMVDVLRQVGAKPDDLDRLFPTYRVHVYYDTGETWIVDGVTYPLLGLQPSFGFYAYHEGELAGFNHQLRGAIRVTENFYVLRVPNNGSTKITTIIHGVAPDEIDQIEVEEPIREWPKKPELKWYDNNPNDQRWLLLLKAICRLVPRLLGRSSDLKKKD